MSPFQANSYSFLQDHNRCTRARCALLCKFFLLTLSKLLSNEFLTDNSLMMKKYYKNNCEFHEIVTKQCTAQCRHSGMYLGKSSKVARTFLKSDLFKTQPCKSLHKYFSRILRLFMEASTYHNMTLDTYTFQFFVSIVTSKMELFGTVFNSFYFLIIATKN